MAIRGWWCALILGTTLACGGEEFESGSGGTSSGGTSSGGTSSGGTSSGGTSNGGTSGSGSSGGVGTGGVAGSVNPNGGQGGGAGAGGSVSIPGCSLKPGAPILLHTTLDNSTAIQTPDTGIPPGTSSGQLVPGKCPTGAPNGGLAINTQGDFLTYSGQGNINLVTGTVDFFFKSTAANAGTARHLLSVLGKFLITIDEQGNLLVGVGAAVARTIPASAVPFTTNTWVRVTITWKFGATDETVQVYFDGNGVGGSFTPGPLGVPALGEDPIFIGANGENDPLVAQGVFDDIKIYDGTEEP